MSDIAVPMLIALACVLVIGIYGAAYAAPAPDGGESEGSFGPAVSSPVEPGDPTEPGAPTDPVAPEAETVTVIAGQTQFDTSAAQAVAAFPDGCGTVIVASGTNPIDALAATSLAGALDCPILLTSKDSLPASVAETVVSLGCSHAIVVGGEAVVSAQVETQLEAAMSAAASAKVERLAGSSQYDTQLKIFEYGRACGLWSGCDTLFVASGMPASMADGLSVSPVAYKLKAPIFLVDGNGDLPAASVKALAGDASYARAVLVGGTAVVSDRTFGFMQGVTMCHDGSDDVVRIAGETLYDTSAAVARWAVEHGVLTWTHAAFATGRAPYDALAGSALQGKSGSVLLLIDSGWTTVLDAAVSAGADAVKHVRFFGGEAVMPESLRTLVIERLGVEVAPEPVSEPVPAPEPSPEPGPVPQPAPEPGAGIAPAPSPAPQEESGSQAGSGASDRIPAEAVKGGDAA